MLNTIHYNLIIGKHLDCRLKDTIQNHHHGLARGIGKRDIQLDVTALIGTRIHTHPIVCKVPLESCVAAFKLVIGNWQNGILPHHIIALV